MLGVYIYVCIYTGEIVRIDLEMRILRAECVLRGCSGGALVHTFPSSFSSISPGSGSTPFFTLPRLRFASQTYPIFWRTGHATRSRISSLILLFFYFISLTDTMFVESFESIYTKMENLEIENREKERRSQYVSFDRKTSFVRREERVYSILRFRQFSYRFE